jgi:COP9 signalosome complex subunit 2
MGDPFIKDYMDDVLQNIRNQVLVQIVAPYQTVSLPYLCEQLGGGVSVKEVENLLVGLILNGKISGRIDQLSGLLELSSKPGFSDLHKRVEQERYDALLKWTDALQVHLDSVKVK